MFDAHLIVWAFALDLLKAGRSNAARIAMMAMTTSSSIKVNPAGPRRPAAAFEAIDGGSFMSFWRLCPVNTGSLFKGHNTSLAVNGRFRYSPPHGSQGIARGFEHDRARRPHSRSAAPRALWRRARHPPRFQTTTASSPRHWRGNRRGDRRLGKVSGPRHRVETHP